MDILHLLQHWESNFFGLEAPVRIIRSGDYSSLRTVAGILSFIGPIMPVVVVIEFILICITQRFQITEYKISVLSYLVNWAVAKFIYFAAIAYCTGLFSPYAIFKSDFTWYWLIYGYIVFELGHYIYHYLAHKVRLLWCLHSPHHAPEKMNMGVNWAHFFLEEPYAELVRTTVCVLLGVNVGIIWVAVFIEAFWGGFIHMGDRLGKKARLGPLYNYMLTPSHHRVHHGRNPIYMDTNFCEVFNIWDRLFGTYQPELDDVPIDYGITRPVIKNSFMDAYFGEIVLLAKDVYRAPGIKNKFLYLIMPPGWSHTGNHKMATGIRKAALQERLVNKGERKRVQKRKEVINY